MRENIKRLAATAGHGRSVPRRLPKDLGGLRFPASLEGGSKFLKLNAHNFDPVLTDFAVAYVKPGHVVWDIGANVGLFTFVAAGLAGRDGHVVAVEADTWLAGRLRRAADWNRERARVDVLPVAVSAEPGVGEFIIARSTRATNYLAVAGGSTMTAGVREIQYVPTLPLDTLLGTFPIPDIIKIDVEGAERQVLAGARGVLDSRPTLLLEAFPDHDNDLHELLAPYGYQYKDATTHRPVDRPTFNVICEAK
jgi:FkbM family methyltransferase